MDIILSNSSELPFYQQIKNQIKQAILKGTLQEGDLLPSIRNLADDLQVSVLTIRRVYNELETEGYLNSRMGKGTFVAMANSELIMESKRHMIETKLQQVVVEAICIIYVINKNKKEERINTAYGRLASKPG